MLKRALQKLKRKGIKKVLKWSVVGGGHNPDFQALATLRVQVPVEHLAHSQTVFVSETFICFTCGEEVNGASLKMHRCGESQ